VDVLSQSGQVGGVFGAVLSLFKVSDVVYFIDIPIVIYLFHRTRLYKVKLNKLVTIALIIVFSSSILVLSFLKLQRGYSDQYRVALIGILPTHIYDFTGYIIEKRKAIALAKEEKQIISEYQRYFKDKKTKQSKAPDFGKYKGKNLIIVQAESFNNFLVNLKVNGQEITPNLNKLASESNYYNNIYLQIGRGNTSDAEFVANNSLVPVAPKGVYKTYPKNNYLSLGKILLDEGYITSATHGNIPGFWNRQEAYGAQGYETFYHIDHENISKDHIVGMGISDESIFKQMANIYKEYDSPFYNFIVTLTHHRPFDLPKEYQELDLPEKFNGTVTGNYLQSAYYFDKALGNFISELKADGTWDDSIFVIYGDHYGPVPNDAPNLKKLINVTFDQKEMFRIPLIIHHPGQQEGKEISKLGSQLDIYPTLTSLLSVDRPLLQLGESLDIEGEGFVGFEYETTKKSFYSDDYDYVASHDGVFKNGTCYENKSGKVVNVSKCKKGYNRFVKYVEISNFILSRNTALKIVK
jgi:phosphoglycerol transferase MdoB-like AlkP superfamily enzyme